MLAAKAGPSASSILRADGWMGMAWNSGSWRRMASANPSFVAGKVKLSFMFNVKRMLSIPWTSSSDMVLKILGAP